MLKNSILFENYNSLLYGFRTCIETYLSISYYATILKKIIFCHFIQFPINDNIIPISILFSYLVTITLYFRNLRLEIEQHIFWFDSSTSVSEFHSLKNVFCFKIYYIFLYFTLM